MYDISCVTMIKAPFLEVLLDPISLPDQLIILGWVYSRHRLPLARAKKMGLAVPVC